MMGFNKTHREPLPSMNTKTFKLLQEADWETIYKKLLAYTLQKARYLRWRGVTGISNKEDELIAGKSCSDIVQTVIEKTIEGTRQWDPDKGALEPWLRQQLNSEISHLVESRPHKNEVASISDEIENSTQNATTSPPTSYYSTDPETIILNQQYIEEKLSILYEAADGDPDLDAIITAVMDGCEPKPRYLAEELGTTTKDINNRLRKLMRRAMKVETR